MAIGRTKMASLFGTSALLLAVATGCGSERLEDNANTPNGPNSPEPQGPEPVQEETPTPQNDPDPNVPEEDPIDLGLLQVSGEVVDFETGYRIAGEASVTVTGVQPAPSVTVSGAVFVIENVPPNSALTLLVGAPGYVNTYAAKVTAQEQDVSGVQARAVSATYLIDVAEEFGKTPSITDGVLIAKVKDEDGYSYEGVDAGSFYLNDARPAAGPYFFDADYRPDADLQYTSASGSAVFFEVAPGYATISSPGDAAYDLAMPTAPIGAGAITLATVYATPAEVEVVYPQNVSFAEDVRPIFEAYDATYNPTGRGCVDCHFGGGPANRTAGLHLDGSANQIFNELNEPSTELPASTRLDYDADPADSLLLVMPSAEGVASYGHWTEAWGPNDEAYRIVYGWLQEGAQNN